MLATSKHVFKTKTRRNVLKNHLYLAVFEWFDSLPPSNSMKFKPMLLYNLIELHKSPKKETKAQNNDKDTSLHKYIKLQTDSCNMKFKLIKTRTKCH